MYQHVTQMGRRDVVCQDVTEVILKENTSSLPLHNINKKNTPNTPRH